MIKFKRDLHRAGLLTVQFLFFAPFSLGFLFLLTFAADQYFEYLSQLLNGTDQGPWPAQVGEFCFSIINGFALLLIGGHFLVNLHEKITLDAFCRRFLAPLTAESLRALTSIMLWSLALILPGVIMYCRLSFVPFIVFVDPTFKTRPDSIARSKELTKDCWFQLTLFMIGLTIIETLFEIAPSLLTIESLVLRFPFELCGFLFSLYSLTLLYVIFDNLVKKSADAKGA